MNDYSENIPKIVEEKCEEAYAQIRLEAASGKKRFRWSTRRKTITAISIAISAALCITFAAPAVASSKMVQNIFSYFGMGNIYTAPPGTQNDLTQFAQCVGMQQTGESGTLEFQSVYFDGTDLSMTVLLTDVPEEYRDYTQLLAEISLQIGNETVCPEHTTTILYHTDFGFCGVITAVYDGEPTETLPLQFAMDSYDAWNEYVMIQNAAGGYDIQSAYDIPMNVTMETEITANSNYTKTYEIGETKNGFTLQSVTVSPFSTIVQFNDAFEKAQHVKVKVTDQTGTNFEEITWNEKFEAALTTTTQLRISIIQEDIDGLPVAADFIVPIESGYRTQISAKPTFDPDKVNYIPPRDETLYAEKEYNYANATQIHAAQENKPIEALDIYASYKDTSLYENNDTLATMTVSVTKSYLADRNEIFSMIESYDGGSNYALVKDFFSTQHLNADELELDMLLVDYTITNTQNVDCEFCMSSMSLITKDMMYPASPSELVYCSYRDYGGNWSNIYEFAPNETRTITVGYLVTPETAQKGFYFIDNCKGFAENGDSNSRLGIIPDLTE